MAKRGPKPGTGGRPPRPDAEGRVWLRQIKVDAAIADELRELAAESGQTVDQVHERAVRSGLSMLRARRRARGKGEAD